MGFTSNTVLTAAALNTFDPSTKITNAAGSASAPSYTFNGDTDTGMYRIAADQIGFTVGGGAILTLTTDAIQSSGEIRGNNGSASSPTFNFASDQNTGIYRRAADEIGFATGGAERARIGSFGMRFVGSDSVYNMGTVKPANGSASAPAYSFVSDANTGFFITGNNGYTAWSGNGTEGGRLYSTGVRAVNGSAGTPTYSFSSDTNTGMFRSGADEIGFACGGSEVFQILTNGVLTSSGDNYFGTPTTGTGNDAEWSSTGFGTYMLKRNSSLTAEKENITTDLGTHLTADMIDSVVPKMWNRLNSPGYPEIGPLAEDMDAISPFLAAHGADITDGTYQEFLSGINKTAYLSLLVLAVKDLRARVATLEA